MTGQVFEKNGGLCPEYEDVNRRKYISIKKCWRKWSSKVICILISVAPSCFIKYPEFWKFYIEGNELGEIELCLNNLQYKIYAAKKMGDTFICCMAMITKRTNIVISHAKHYSFPNIFGEAMCVERAQAWFWWGFGSCKIAFLFSTCNACVCNNFFNFDYR